jgi:OTU domain-containing protein 3
LCLKVREMGGDGNCFFRAIADQITGDESRHMEYRHHAVDYIRANKDMYVPFIEDDETIEQYCDDMEKDGIWGDQLETNALASCFKFNIIVHRVDTPSMAQVFHEPVGKFPTLHLSYHLGEHYNSVRRIDDPCVKGISPLDEYVIGHDIDKVKKLVGDKGGDDEGDDEEEKKEDEE